MIVVGAGLSGLVTARRLDQAGITSVRVLEARARVGGRTKLHQLVTGRFAEEGGQLVGPEYKRLIALGEELGVSTWPHFEDGKTVFERGGHTMTFSGAMPWLADPIGSADFTQSAIRLDRVCKRSLGDEQLATPAAAKLDALTFASWINRATKTSAARTLWALISALTLGSQPGDHSLMRVLRHLRSLGGVDPLLASLSGGEERSFTGGSAELSHRMATELGDRVVIESPISAIRQHDDYLQVDTANGTLTADADHRDEPVRPRRDQHRPALPLPQRTLGERLVMTWKHRDRIDERSDEYKIATRQGQLIAPRRLAEYIFVDAALSAA